MKRILSLIMCICMLFSGEMASIVANAIDLIPGVTATSGTKLSVSVTMNGSAVSDIYINDSERKTLKAAASGFEASKYQWQILTDKDNNIWVNIFDKTESECEISYALIKGMLDSYGTAYVRCAVSDAKGNRHISDAVSVTFFSTDIVRYSAVSVDNAAIASNPALVSDEGESSGYISITIEYIRVENGVEKEVYKPYVAKIQSGTDFIQTVISPTLLGYAPKSDIDGDGVREDAASVDLNFTALTESIDIKVYYEPIEVSYAIRYFFQDISDDLYTENVGLYTIKKALTGTTVSEDDLKLTGANSSYAEGFTKMYHIPDSVAADGSTVFECYYDRVYYLINFDNNGGYGTDPIYARYGTPFIVNDPIRYGYIFLGWDTNGNGKIDDGDSVPSEIQATNDENGDPLVVTYTAIWERADTTFKVAYWSTDSTGKNYYIGSKLVDAKAGDVVSAGDHLLTDDTYICGKAEHKHTNDCYTVLHKHTIDCFDTTFAIGGTPGTQDLLAIGKIGDGEPEAGFLYTINASGDGNTYYYWYFGTDENGDQIWKQTNVNNSNYVSGDPLGDSSVYFTDVNRTWTAKKYYPKTVCGYEQSNGMHLSCTLDFHTHTSDCQYSDSHLDLKSTRFEFGEVKGDGSTVLNAYYKHKEFTLRFYYARSYDSTDGTVYQVVGGSTYMFGSYANVNSSTTVGDLLAQVYSNQWGKVKELPKLKDSYINDPTLIEYYDLKSGATEKDFESRGTYIYYYIEFTATFGSDISSVWPVDVFEPAEIDEKHSSHGGTDDNYCNYPNAYFSAWNGQYGVKYSHSHGNQTIKGTYQYLDENLIFDPSLNNLVYDSEDPDRISYLCFWENGADIGWSLPKIFEYNIYHEVLVPDESSDDIIEHNGKKYQMIKSFNVYDNSDVAGQTPITYEGYASPIMESTRDDDVDGMEKYTINFYYNRQTDTKLNFFNFNSIDKVLSGISFGSPLAPYFSDEYFKAPPYPDELEQGAYKFGGWYTSSACYDGSEFDYTTATMPSSDLTLYAKWYLVSHNVNFFNTLDELRRYEDDPTSTTPLYSFVDSNAILHGNVIGSVANPVNGDLTFKGWFYINESGEKTAFLPTNMPVGSDLNIYAEWESRTPVQFRIQYVLYSDPSVKVADDTVGYSFANTTRTFQAKAGGQLDQLYEPYKNGYYPTIASHSITMQNDENDNVYTFYYVQAHSLTYTINYINKETNTVMSSETHTTSDTVVTVRYKTYNNMVPDAFYKRLVLSTNESSNVINFYYTPNEEKVYYAVHFMLEKLGISTTDRHNYDIDGNGAYDLSDIYVTGVANKGESVTVSSNIFSGFTVTDKAVVVAGDTESGDYTTNDNGSSFTFNVSEDGVKLYIFYTRNTYKYRVHYYQYNTETKLQASLEGSAQYGRELSFVANDIPGFTCVNADESGRRELVIQEDNNDVIFYYAPVQRVIEYIAVVDGQVLNDAGWLSINREIPTGADHIIGSEAKSNKYYKFDGWYTDPSCTIPVSEANGALYDLDDDGIYEKFVPDNDKLSDKENNIFYAKFTPYVSDITVKLNGGSADEVYILEIKNNQTHEVIYIALKGNESATVKGAHFNSYTVSLVTDWNWRYDTTLPSLGEHTGSGGTTFTIDLRLSNEQWISSATDALKNVHSEVTYNE